MSHVLRTVRPQNMTHLDLSSTILFPQLHLWFDRSDYRIHRCLHQQHIAIDPALLILTLPTAAVVAIATRLPLDKPPSMFP